MSSTPVKNIKPVKSNATFERPLVTVDLVIFATLEDCLEVLLVKRPESEVDPFPGRWALPGGFLNLDRDQSLEDCALRKLREKTGVVAPYLEQLGSWGGLDRDPRGWSVTQAYFALIARHPAQTIQITAGSTQSSWIAVADAQKKRLAFDHAKILDAALNRLRSKVEYTSLPAFLLEEPFTLPTLQKSYEVVLDRSLDKSAFRKRMLDADFLQEAGTIDGSGGRMAMGYKIKDRTRAVAFPRTFKVNE